MSYGPFPYLVRGQWRDEGPPAEPLGEDVRPLQMRLDLGVEAGPGLLPDRRHRLIFEGVP